MLWFSPTIRVVYYTITTLQKREEEYAVRLWKSTNIQSCKKDSYIGDEEQQDFFLKNNQCLGFTRIA